MKVVNLNSLISPGSFFTFRNDGTYNSGIALLNAYTTTLDHEILAIDLGIPVLEKCPQKNEKHQIKLTKQTNPNFGVLFFQQPFFSFKRPSLLINCDMYETAKLRIHEKFLLKKGFSVCHFWKNKGDFCVYKEFLSSLDLKKYKSGCLVFENGESFFEYLQVAVEFPLIHNIVLHNIWESEMLIKYLKQIRIEETLNHKCSILIANHSDDDNSRGMREFFAIFRERNPSNEIYFVEYEAQKPDLFSSLLVSFLG